MSSIPSNTFLSVNALGPKTEKHNVTIWAEIKMVVRSVREAWQPRADNEPVETFMNY